MSLLRILALATLLSLAACAGSPGIPETTYFRLPPRAPMQKHGGPQLPYPIVVDTLLADGLHSDQAIIYSLDPEGARLRAYHYQLWVDPPVRMLQRRLIGALRDANVAPLVADRLPTQTQALRVEGRIERFERIKVGDAYKIAVALSLRADLRDGKPPLVIKEYLREAAVPGNTVRDSVNAIARALDEIYAEFAADIVSGGARA
jgi:ABC-type uncharacterized transport system auxiliary subunit